MLARVTTSARRGVSSRGQTGNRTSTARNVQNRSIKDITYFKGQIHAKVSELRHELHRIQQEIRALQRQEASTSVNAKQAQNLAEELTANQSVLADLNTAIEKVSVGCKLPDLLKELSDLKEINDQVEKEHEILYANRIDKQKEISETKAKISSLRQTRPILTSSDYEAIKNDPEKYEWAKLELRMMNLENLKQSLDRDLTAEPVDPEEEITLMIEKLADLVLKKLEAVSKRMKDFPKQEQYERFLAKNLSDFAKEDMTPLRLIIDLSVYAEQVKMINRNVHSSIIKLRDKTMDLKGVWSSSLNLTDLENAANRKKSVLCNQKTNLECRNSSLQITLDMRRAEMENYQRQMMKSKDYSNICDLELELSNLRRINYELQQYLDEGKCLQDLQECTNRTLTLVNRLNEKFKSSLNH